MHRFVAAAVKPSEHASAPKLDAQLPRTLKNNNMKKKRHPSAVYTSKNYERRSWSTTAKMVLFCFAKPAAGPFFPGSSRSKRAYERKVEDKKIIFCPK